MAKHTLKFIQDQIGKEGFKLLSTEYKCNKEKLDMECPKGHKISIPWSWYRRGSRCKFCNAERLAKIKSMPYAFVKKSFEEAGYKFLSDRYFNNCTPIEYECPKGHIGTITWASWKQGHGCKVCGGIKSRKTAIEYIRNEFELEGYKLLSEKYINSKAKLDYVCQQGHTGSISWFNWKNGTRCGQCRYETLADTARIPIKDIKNSFESEGYKLLTTVYKTRHDRLEYICKNGHHNSVNYSKWQVGRGRCPICNCGKSAPETEIYSFIKENFKDAKNNVRGIIPPFELDTIIPSKKTAIEYCGLYWHSELKGKDNKYHINKLDRCSKTGYTLITIFEDEWINKKDIVEKRLLYKLGKFAGKKVYARNCTILEIDSKLKDEFLDKYHIQGKDRSSIKLGAYFEDNLVAVMTFHRGSIAKGSKLKENTYELNRFCSDYNYNVVGIASKLFKYFTKNYNPTEIYSYADRRWNTGESYKNLGFKLDSISKPNYWYITGVYKRAHRFNFRKSELRNKLKIFDPNISEWENMKKNKFDRIWDCGNIKFIWEG